MPRSARIISESGYIHIYTRGNSKQILFENRSDYIYYLKLLKQLSQEKDIKICAFCLMENHTHMLVYDKNNKISDFMKILNLTYTGYFNKKYKRSGSLFEGRYKSIPVESEEYLLTVFRYVLNNPRDGNVSSADKYPYSSYSRYGKSESFVDTSVFQELIGDQADYDDFLKKGTDKCPELEGLPCDDNWGKMIIRTLLHLDSGTELQSYDMQARNEALRFLKRKGLTIRQIERLTGISHGVIEQALFGDGTRRAQPQGRSSRSASESGEACTSRSGFRDVPTEYLNDEEDDNSPDSSVVNG